MELMADKLLATGETLRIWHWKAPEKMPHRYLSYIIASFAELHSEKAYGSGWTSYICSTAEGREYPAIKDHWFIADVDGVSAGRLWFSYSAKTGRGNFGNIETEPIFRRRGILNELLKAFKSVADKCDDMRMLCCSTGTDYAADSYRKVGFETVNGARVGVMCYCKNGTFKQESEAAFSGDEIASIRPGERDDQFEIDKFLLFQDGVRYNDCHNFIGYATWYAEFRLIYQEALNGNGIVLVAENKQRTIVGYAYALHVNGTPFFNFVCHPAYMRKADKLIRRAAKLFQEKFGFRAHLYCDADDAAKIAVAQRAGAEPCAVLPKFMKRGDVLVDVRDFLV